MAKVSIKSAVRRAHSDERRAHSEQRRAKATADSSTADSFQNFAAGLGIGTNNLSSGNTYGFNPISRIRTELEWMYRGTWLAAAAVDVIANDMTREGIELTGELEPDEIAEIKEEATTLRIWDRINQTIKWARLYGGCIAVLLVDGQDYSKPFRIDTVGENQFKGLLVLDRWMVFPTLNDMVTEIGPDLGLPKYYVVDSMAPALRGQKIHYSRCLRLLGDELPYWQATAENLWGMSVLERAFPLISYFDSATAGAAQMVSKAYLRYLKVEKYRDILATGGQAKKGLMEMAQFMRLASSNESVVMIDAKDDIQTTQATALTGMGEVLLQIAQQVSGDLQIPLVKLLGQSPAGLNSTGESDIKNYYDGIRQRQQYTRTFVTKVYRCLAQSRRLDVQNGFGIEFRPLWQMDEVQKSEIAQRDTAAVIEAREAGLISDKVALQELQHCSETTGHWKSITADVIEAASDEILPKAEPLAEPLPKPEMPKAEMPNSEESDGERIAA